MLDAHVGRHITINGDLGSGKSTVARKIAKALDLELISTGALQRQIASELQLSTLRTNLAAERDKTIDKRVDSLTVLKSAAAEKPLVFDSRMAWHFVKNAFRVRLLVDPEVAASRIYRRSFDAVEVYESLDDVRQSVRERFESEARRFEARYGVDIAATSNYNLVIDTSDVPVEDVVGRVLEWYESEWLGSEILVSPRRIVPLDGHELGDPSAVLDVAYLRPFFFGLDRASLDNAVSETAPWVPAAVRYEGMAAAKILLAADAADPGLSRVRAWEQEHGLHLTSFWELWRRRGPQRSEDTRRLPSEPALDQSEP